MKEVFFDELKAIDLDQSEQMDEFCRKYILHGIPYVFQGDEMKYFNFRRRIANKYSVSFHEIYVTGSGKLGFSPYKNKDFDLDSDIDVAIISEDLFDIIMFKIMQFQMSYKSNRRTLTVSELKMYHEFLEYVAIGWIRPDKLPLSFQMSDLKGSWFDYFESISFGKSEVGNYKVAAGIFKSYFHYENYLTSSFTKIKNVLTIQGQLQ